MDPSAFSSGEEIVNRMKNLEIGSLKRSQSGPDLKTERPVEVAKGPFVVKPLNRKTLVRKNWTKNSPPQSAQKRLDEKKIFEVVEDQKLATVLFHKERDKRRDSKKRAGQDRKQLKVDPLARKTSPLLGRKATEAQVKRTDHGNSFLHRAQPQMDSFFRGMGLNHTLTLDEKSVDVVENLRTTVSEVAKTLSSPSVNLKVESEGFKTLEKIGDHTRDFAILAVMIAVILIMRPSTRSEKTLVYMALIGIVATRLDLLKFLTESSILSWLKGGPISPQIGGGMGDDFAVIATSMINLYVCGSFGKDIFQPKEFLRISTLLSRSTPTVANIIKGVNLLVQYVSRGLEYFFLDRKDFRSGVPFIDTFLKEYDDIITLHEEKRLYAMQDSVDRVKACIKYGDSIVMQIPVHSDHSSVRYAVCNALADLKKIRKELMSTNFLYAGIRQEPVSVLMIGRPGTFKSQAMQHLAHAYSARTLSNEEWERYKANPVAFSFNMQAENVYYDGYRQDKNVVFIDDILQARDIQGNPDNEAMKVIRAINIFENVLHMSSIEDKGNVNFRSKLVLANTNMENFSFESIHDPGAFMRRWDIVVRVTPKPEFSRNPEAEPSARAFDRSKFPRRTAESVPDDDPGLIDSTVAHPDMCDYHLLKLNNAQRGFEETGDYVSFEALVEMIVGWEEEKSRYHRGYLLDLDETLRNQRKLREESQFVDAPEFSIEDDIQLDELLNETISPQIGDEVVNFDEMDFDNPDGWNYVEGNGPATADFVPVSGAVFVPIAPVSYDAEPMAKFRQLGRLQRIWEKNRRSAYLLAAIMDNLQFGSPVHEEIWYRYYARIIEQIIPLIEVFFDNTLMIDFEFDDTERFPWLEMNDYRDMIEAILLWFGQQGLPCRWEDKGIVMDFCLPDGRLDTGAVLKLNHMAQPQVGKSFLNTLLRRKTSQEAVKVESEDRQPLSYTLSNSNAILMAGLRDTDFKRYIAIDTGIKLLCAESLTLEGIELIPDDVFHSLWSASDFDDFEKEFGSGDMIDVRKFVRSVQTPVPSRRGTFYRIDSAVSEALVNASNKKDTVDSFLYTMYHGCCAYLASFGIGGSSQKMRALVSSRDLQKKAGLVFAGFAALAAGIKVARGLVSVIFGDGLLSQSDERRTHVNRSRISRRPNLKPKAAPHSISHTNQNLVNVMSMVLTRSLFEMWLPSDEEDGVMRRAGFAIAVKGRCFIMPYHFASQIATRYHDGIWKDTDEIRFFIPRTGTLHYVITVKQFMEGVLDYDEGEKRDVILLRMPREYQPRKDITSHFASEKQQSGYTKVDSVLFIPGRDGNEIHSQVAQYGAGPCPVGDDEWEPYVVNEVYRYRAATTFGDCGAPLYADDKQKTSLIIGFHVAGITSARTGFSVKITREFIEDYLRLAGEKYTVEDQLGLDIIPTDDAINNMEVLGVANPHSCKVPGRQIETSLRYSPIKDKIFISDKCPARLRPFTLDGERIDPFDIATAGYSPPDVYISEEMCKAARFALEDHLRRVSSNSVDKRLMTLEESVVGESDDPLFGSIPRVTSAGFPYNTMPGLKSKCRFFGEGDDYDLTTPEAKALFDNCREIEEKARKGIRCTHVFTDALKDEKRTFEKYRVGKTRLFSACPTELLILLRRFFGSFVKWIIANRVHNGIAIGITEQGSDWELVARYLNQFGTHSNKGAGDFQGLDKNELARIHYHILDIVNDWYDDGWENAQARNTLFLELVNSLHVNRNRFMYWRGSMPSGIFLTAVFNSLYVQMLFRLSWIKLICPKTMDAHSFNSNVYLIVLGDDNVFSVRGDYKDVFTEKNLQVSMKCFGQIYTPEVDKGGEFIDTLRSLEEVSFLKRMWRIHELTGTYVGPLDLNSILDITNWVKKGGNAFGDTEANLKVVFEELSLHPRSVFEHWKKKIVDVVEATPGLTLPPKTNYGSVFAEVRSRDGDYEVYKRYLVDYDGLSGKSRDIQAQSGRSKVQRTELFSFTARMVRRQSLQNPGNSGVCGRLSHQPQIGRRDATQPNSDSALDETTAQATTGVIQESRVEEVPSNISGAMTRASADASVVQGRADYVPLNAGLLTTSDTGASFELRSFLARPKIVASGLFASTDVVATPLKTFSIPSGFINTAGDIWQERLRGVGLFRGTLHLTLQLNGNRFQQGRYMLVFTPSGGGFNTVPWYKMHTAHLVERTQNPHVEIDVNCDTEASLIIPHVNVQGWATVGVGSTYGDIGQITLWPYSPLVAPSGSAACSYTLYAHYEDVEVAMPVVPQSGRVGRKVRRRVNPTEAEQDAGNIGPIEAIASRVATASSRLVGVPVLSSVAGPVSWAADIAANVASAFGWSRPHNSGTVGLSGLQVFHRMTNVDAPDNGQKLAFFDRNEIEDLPDFAGSPYDEMSLNHIASISSYFVQQPWTTAHGSGTKLLSLRNTPRTMYVNTPINGQNVGHLTPLAAVSRFFAMWRGTIRYTFKLVKTEFHSGRLMVVWAPAIRGVTNPGNSIANSSYLHRQILDVRNGNEFTVDVPYSSMEQYKPTTGLTKHTGYLEVFVLNPLVAPATVSSTVTILVEVAAGPDFEFAVPAANAAVNTIPFAPQIGRSNVCEIQSAPIGNSRTSASDLPARTCIGERILSLRSLLKRFSRTGGDAQAAGQTICTFYPHGVYSEYINSTNVHISNGVAPDLFDVIAPWFAQFRGSMRYKIISVDPAKELNFQVSALPSNPSNYLWNKYYQWGSWPLSYFTVVDNRSLVWARGNSSGGAEVEYPFHCAYPSAAVCDMMLNPQGTTLQVDMTSPTVPQLLGTVEAVGTGGTIVASPMIYRAMGEDGSLGSFVSTTPMRAYDPDSLC